MTDQPPAQASDEPMRAAFETWCGDARYQFVALQRMSGGRYVHPGVQADWEVWQASRAALKAQPAPTEDQGGKLLELFKHTLGALAAHDSAEAERIGKLYRGERSSGNSGELAQGEDSARLDAERYQWLCDEYGITWLPCFLEHHLRCGYVADGKESVDDTIDRARASAETGGVKS